MSDHPTLPVAGYRAQSTASVDMVNMNKTMEERLLRVMEDYGTNPNVDPRWLAIAKTNIEQGFMALNRAIFKPGRVRLAEDDVD